MKKITKILAVCMVVALLSSILASCSVSPSKVAGTYSGTYTYNGSSYSVGIVLSEDGDYAKVTYKNGSMYSSETGKYEIKGKKVRLINKGSGGGVTEYKFKSDTLINNGHKFTKKK